MDIGENEPAKTGEQLSDYAASWDGFVEAYNFPSGSDRVRLVLDANGNGTFEVGEDVDYGTPEAGVALGVPRVGTESVPFRTLLEGFQYSVRAAAVNGSRLQFGVDGYEVYTEWCAVQTPYLETTPPPQMRSILQARDPAGTYVCIDGAPTPEGSDFNDFDDACTVQDSSGSETPVSCAFEQYCVFPGAPCTCTSDGCAVVPETGDFENRIDGALEGSDSFTATLVFSDAFRANQRLTIRLTRQ